jgi:hypothetical protein
MIIPHFSLFGSPHTRIYNDPHHPASAPIALPAVAPANFPITRSTAALGAPGLVLMPSAVGADIALKIGEYTVEHAPAAISNIWRNTRWGIGKILGTGMNILERGGRFLGRGVGESSISTTSRFTRNNITSLLNWGVHLPLDALKVPGSVINGAIGVTQGALSIPLGVIGRPLSWLGIKAPTKWSNQLWGAAKGNVKELAAPLENTLGTVQDIYQTTFDNAVGFVEGIAAGWTGAIHEPWTEQYVRPTAAAIANAPSFWGNLLKNRQQIHGLMQGSGALRPARYRGGEHGADHGAVHGGGDHGGGDHGGGHAEEHHEEAGGHH